MSYYRQVHRTDVSASSSGRSVFSVVHCQVQPDQYATIGIVETVYFSVDVHLLAELGERLVGRPAIALGELVKNSYDADASQVRVSFTDDDISVVDDGHGMSEKDLHEGFLRIGTARKERKQFSPDGRRMTGSKGVGRLAAQMLGRRLVLETRSASAPHELLKLTINWDDKQEGDEITKFAATLERPSEAELLKQEHGTAIRIEHLTREWDPEDVRELAQDIWMLRSPFPGDQQHGFTIQFEAHEESFEKAFEEIIEGWVDLYEAKVVGELHGPHDNAKGHPADVIDRSHVHISLEFQDSDIRKHGSKRSVVLPARSDTLGAANFEIRIYKLQGRQPLGLSVNEVRDYLNRFGGVYLYDDGFRMPYYGPDTDWLGVEMDHAHRISRSKVLPKDLQIAGGGTFLPTTSRVFGAVHVSTSRERELVAENRIPEQDSLQIQISRDRLLDTEAFDTLKAAVRAGLDLYAHEKGRRRLKEAEERLQEAADKSDTAADPIDILESVSNELPEETYQLITDAITIERSHAESQIEVANNRAATMATLATAGMVSILMEHEHARLLPRLRAFAADHIADKYEDSRAVAYEIQQFVEQLDALSPMLHSVMEPENRETSRLSARRTIRRAVETIGPLLRGIDLDIEVDDNVRLPEGTLAEWTALIQNVLLNAANAVMTQENPRIKIVARGGARSIRVLDNGYGIDVEESERFFEPFIRGDQQLPPDRKALGMGGTGLGLTIVRTIAEASEAQVRFESPRRPWSTAFVLSW